MNIKIQCPCGARYSFEVEPREGRLPAPIHCPACQADGTEAANELIAAQIAAAPEAAPRARLQVTIPGRAAPKAAAPEEAAPGATESGAVFCNRHPTHPAAEFCVVCQKPICPECMAAFGYVCSAA